MKLKNIDEQLEHAYDELSDFEHGIRLEQAKNESEIKWWRRAGFFAICAGLLAFVVPPFLPEHGSIAFNDYGEFVGGFVASIWSLAGLMFIYVAFLGQKLQLLLQQLELRHTKVETLATRAEIKGQKEELKQQNSTLKSQQFENTFFKLLTNLHQIVNSLEAETSSKTFDEANPILYKTLRGINVFEKMQEIIKDSELNINSFENAVTSYHYSIIQNLLEPYHTTLAIILDFVDNTIFLDNSAEVNTEKRIYYMNIVIKPMSFTQKVALAYHIGISDSRNPYDVLLKKIEKKYKLLKDLHTQERISGSYYWRVLVDAKIHNNEDCPRGENGEEYT